MKTLREAAAMALEALETVLTDAYHRRFPECCGRPGSECCGNPNEAWTPEDSRIMDVLSPAQRQLSEALRAALDAPMAEPQDPVAYNGWVLREVLFDNGEPVGHREPTNAEPQEPVLVVEKEPDYWSGGHFYKGDKPHIDPTKVWGLQIGTKLYTAPQPRRSLDDKQLEVVIYEHTKLNPNQADDRELIGYIINAIRAIERAHGIEGEK
jgi:hypothetical protein